jgi:hypothetical protein
MSRLESINMAIVLFDKDYRLIGYRFADDGRAKTLYNDLTKDKLEAIRKDIEKTLKIYNKDPKEFESEMINHTPLSFSNFIYVPRHITGCPKEILDILYNIIIKPPSCLYHTIINRLKEIMDGCTCLEAYNERGLIDPQCMSHTIAEEFLMILDITPDMVSDKFVMWFYGDG